jgi:hypothetical protein
MLSRSLSYAKIVQGERSTKRKPKSFQFVLPSRLFYVKTAQGTNLGKQQFVCLIGGRVFNPRQQHVVDIQSILLLPRVKNPPPN